MATKSMHESCQRYSPVGGKSGWWEARLAGSDQPLIGPSLCEYNTYPDRGPKAEQFGIKTGGVTVGEIPRLLMSSGLTR